MRLLTEAVRRLKEEKRNQLKEEQMATTDTNHNPSGKEEVTSLKTKASVLSGDIKSRCPDNHVRQLALDHLRIATMLAVQSLFEEDD